MVLTVSVGAGLLDVQAVAKMPSCCDEQATSHSKDNNAGRNRDIAHLPLLVSHQHPPLVGPTQIQGAAVPWHHGAWRPWASAGRQGQGSAQAGRGPAVSALFQLFPGCETVQVVLINSGLFDTCLF